MTNSAVQFMRLPMLASSGLAVVASGLLYFKQKFVPPTLQYWCNWLNPPGKLTTCAAS